MKRKIKCRYGVEYEVEFSGSKGACARSLKLMECCCCWVCHNHDCKEPRNEIIEVCGEVCTLLTKIPYCKTEKEL